MTGLLIDTNIYSIAIRGEEGVAEALWKAKAIFVATITIGELMAGFLKGNRPAENNQVLKAFLSNSKVFHLRMDQGTAEAYASILNQLRKKGRPIPTNDLWIAAAAIQHDLPLFTRDKHFKEIDGLNLF